MENTALDSVGDKIVTAKRIKRKSESQVVLVYIKMSIARFFKF